MTVREALLLLRYYDDARTPLFTTYADAAIDAIDADGLLHSATRAIITPLRWH